VQNDIPAPRRKKPKPLVKRQTFCVHDGEYWLIEQRPTNGRWGGMWQFVTVPADGTRLTASKVSRRIGMSVRTPKLIGSVEHALSHRQYHFDVFMCSTTQSSGARQKDLPNRRWVLFERLADYPMPRPHVKMAAMVREIREHAA
jgi:adenine-specific DNA glycosylase